MGVNSIAGMDPQSAAEKAVSVIGQGYDLCSDIRFSACKPCRLIEIDPKRSRDMVFPGGVVVPNVPSSIKCDKGERTRFHTDVLTFNQVITESLESFVFCDQNGKVGKSEFEFHLNLECFADV